MQIQVISDSIVTGREEHADRIAAMIEARLARFADHLTRRCGPRARCRPGPGPGLAAGDSE